MTATMTQKTMRSMKKQKVSEMRKNLDIEDVDGIIMGQGTLLSTLGSEGALLSDHPKHMYSLSKMIASLSSSVVRHYVYIS